MFYNYITYSFYISGRCLRSEADCTSQNEKVNEFRRKLEDTQAALQELGRENQSLQVLINFILPSVHEC